jgi:hypothetical protein
MPIEDYSHMMMEMKLMVDGDEGGEDGGEDGLRYPPSGEKSWIDLISESMIVALTVLCFANSLLLLGHPLLIYMRVYVKAGGNAMLEKRTSRPHAARESSCMGHALWASSTFSCPSGAQTPSHEKLA